MKYVASFDVGTTAVKGVVADGNGLICASGKRDILTYIKGVRAEQAPEDWFGAFCDISNDFFAGGFKEDIVGIIFSGHMQNVIPVDKNMNAVGNALLYSDGRAVSEATEIVSEIGADEIRRTTGNNMDATIAFPKMLWFMRNDKGKYGKTAYILGSAKDYIIGRLTGKAVCDVVAASACGLMDINEKQWRADWCGEFGLDVSTLPEIYYAGDIVGEVNDDKADWYLNGTPVYCGSGDAGAATYAGNVQEAGDYNINIGTTGWIAGISGSAAKEKYVFNLCAVQADKYINVAPFLNAGNVHKWISNILYGCDRKQYESMNGLLEKSKAGSNGLLFLPYITGERFPVLDEKIRGGYYGITPETSRGDMARAAIEAVAFSLRQGLDEIGVAAKHITMIGGGGKVPVWCQVISEVLGKELTVYRDSEFLPALAMCELVLKKRFEKSGNGNIYRPDGSNVEIYNKIYPRYKRLYGALRAMEG